MDKVAVIVVTYNGMKWLQTCFDSLLQSTSAHHVYAIDNGSTDGTVDFIASQYPRIELIQSKENLGFGKANNLGLTKALEDGFDYFFLLNQDGYVFPDTLNNLVNFSKGNPIYGVLSPMQLNGNGTDLDQNFSILMNNFNCPGFINDSYFNKLHSHYELKFVMAAFWLITKEALQKIGLFNPVFPHYGEDNDYLNRVMYHGKKIAIVTNALGRHDREFRESTHQQNIYRSYIDLLIRLCDLNRSLGTEFIKAYIYFVRALLKSFFRCEFRNLNLNFKYYHKILLLQSFSIYKGRKKNRE